MSNEIRLFKTIARMINKFLPGMLEENRVTLAYLITGIIAGKEVQLRLVANKVFYPDKETSLVERFRRFIRNKNIVVKVEFNSFVGLILSGLSQSRLARSHRFAAVHPSRCPSFDINLERCENLCARIPGRNNRGQIRSAKRVVFPGRAFHPAP